jgi:zinc protease
MDDVASNKMYLKLLPEIDADSMAKEVAATWSDGELVIFAAGGLDLGKDAATALRAAWDATEKGTASPTAAAGGPDGKTPGAKPSDGAPSDGAPGDSDDGVSASDWEYRASGAEGKVAKVEQDDALKIARVQFENGVRATLRADPRTGGGAMIVRVGSGLLALDPDESDVGWVASQVFLATGLGSHDYDTMIKMQKGRQLSFGFHVGVDALVFSGSAGPNDLQRLCEIFCAYMKDPGWKPEAFEKWKKGLPEVYESFARGFEGPLGEFDKLLHGGDHRFCVPDPKEVDSFLIDTLKEFLEPQLSEGPVEITLVTGLDPSAAITILGKTFGRLPPRGAADAHEDHRKTPPIQPGLKFKKEIETADKKALLKVVYPTTDGRDTKTRRALSFLDDVVDDRMRVEIREKLGAAYSPSVLLDTGTVFPGMGSLTIVLTVDPAKADTVLNQVLGAVDALAKGGVKPDDLDRMKKVALTKLDQAMDDPGWWLTRLDGSWARPEVLDALKSSKEGVGAVTADEVTALARQYLVRKSASTCVITPKKAAPPPKK